MLLPVLIMSSSGLGLIIGRLVASGDGKWDTRIICPVDGLVEHVAFGSSDKGHVDDRSLPLVRLIGLVLVVPLRYGVNGLNDAARVSLTAALVAADLDADKNLVLLVLVAERDLVAGSQLLQVVRSLALVECPFGDEALGETLALELYRLSHLGVVDRVSQVDGDAALDGLDTGVVAEAVNIGFMAEIFADSLEVVLKCVIIVELDDVFVQKLALGLVVRAWLLGTGKHSGGDASGEQPESRKARETRTKNHGL
ncbi:hypothetical protein HG531_001534 [Fusarium graminearum]|nr:hypothetical protein HG531_001534 [Fusarium graminearum]